MIVNVQIESHIQYQATPSCEQQLQAQNSPDTADVALICSMPALIISPMAALQLNSICASSFASLASTSARTTASLTSKV
jgi:hypothetical protein